MSRLQVKLEERTGRKGWSEDGKGKAGRTRRLIRDVALTPQPTVKTAVATMRPQRRPTQSPIGPAIRAPTKFCISAGALRPVHTSPEPKNWSTYTSRKDRYNQRLAARRKVVLALVIQGTKGLEPRVHRLNTAAPSALSLCSFYSNQNRDILDGTGVVAKEKAGKGCKARHEQGEWADAASKAAILGCGRSSGHGVSDGRVCNNAWVGKDSTGGSTPTSFIPSRGPRGTAYRSSY